MPVLNEYIQKEEFESVSDYDLIKPGWYDVEVSNVETKVTSAGNPMHVTEFTLETGRRVWDNRVLHLDFNRSAIVNMVRACGIDPNEKGIDTDLCLGKRIQIKIGVQPAKNGYDASNNVKGYRPAKPVSSPASTKLYDDIPF